jgi:hypothetical protein
MYLNMTSCFQNMSSHVAFLHSLPLYLRRTNKSASVLTYTLLFGAVMFLSLTLAVPNRVVTVTSVCQTDLLCSSPRASLVLVWMSVLCYCALGSALVGNLIGLVPCLIPFLFFSLFLLPIWLFRLFRFSYLIFLCWWYKLSCVSGGCSSSLLLFKPSF